MIVQFVDGAGANVGTTGTDMNIDGAVYPNQVIAGLLGLVCLGLSAFAFLGAQKHGESVKNMLEKDLETTENKVLASISNERIAAGPSGPPGAAGPAGPPGSAGPSGPPQSDEPSEASPEVVDEATFEPAENGYFFKKLPDGTYDQTVYVQNEDGAYVPHVA